VSTKKRTARKSSYPWEAPCPIGLREVSLFSAGGSRFAEFEQWNWRAEMVALDQTKPEKMPDGVRILELAHNAHFLYFKQTPQEPAALLNMVASNCAIDAVNVYPTYRKPFDVIFAKGKNEGWRARRDSNSRPSGSKPDALSS
jgi:hypothetical protein